MAHAVCLVQARMGSTRLPGKVLAPILDRPMLAWVIDRLRRCELVDEVAVATTTLDRDDAIVTLCDEAGWPVFRGSEEDVLDRYYRAAGYFDADTVLRVTSDCPLIDPGVVDLAAASFRAAAPPVDYVSNFTPRTYPRGLDVEVFSFAALERAWQEDTSAWREHVTPYIRNNPDAFRLHAIANPADFSGYRWTVDEPDDLALVRRIYQHFGHGDFTWQDALAALDAHPSWAAINRDVQQKSI